MVALARAGKSLVWGGDPQATFDGASVPSEPLSGEETREGEKVKCSTPTPVQTLGPLVLSIRI